LVLLLHSDDNRAVGKHIVVIIVIYHAAVCSCIITLRFKKRNIYLLASCIIGNDPASIGAVFQLGAFRFIIIIVTAGITKAGNIHLFFFLLGKYWTLDRKIQ